MASDSDVSVSALIERLMLMPFFPGFATARPELDTNPDPESENSGNRHNPDRLILINPLTQGMVVIGANASGFSSLFNDLMSKNGQPPASQTSIDAMPTVELKCTDEIESLGGECVICLEEWGVGDVAREMPCKHKFHGGCVEKWLKIHGSCPVCRHKMPVDLDKKSGDESESDSRVRREIWVTFAVGSNGRSTSEEQISNQES